MTMIDSFSGEYGFLSNFYEFPVTALWDDDNTVSVPTVEHAFQAAKAGVRDDFYAICSAPTARACKQKGRTITLRPDWEGVKLDVMKRILREKFSNGDLRARLLKTEEAMLVEGNTWGDRFWGVCRGAGENHLGRLLMEIREEIKKSQKTEIEKGDERSRDLAIAQGDAHRFKMTLEEVVDLVRDGLLKEKLGLTVIENFRLSGYRKLWAKKVAE